MCLAVKSANLWTLELQNRLKTSWYRRRRRARSSGCRTRSTNSVKAKLARTLMTYKNYRLNQHASIRRINATRILMMILRRERTNLTAWWTESNNFFWMSISTT